MPTTKPKDPVWSFFIVATQGSKTSARCKDCQVEVSAKAPRLKSHREKCPALKHQEKRPLEDQVPSPESSGSQFTPKRPRLEQSPVSSPQSTPKGIRFEQRSVSSFAVVTDSRSKDMLDEQITRLFLATGIPFAIADHPEFQKTMSMLRPGYKAPNRKAIGGYLLDKVYSKITDNKKAELKDKEVTLVQDGWSDISNNPVIANSLQSSETEDHFLNAIETGSSKKTADYCAALAKDAINLAETDFQCKVTSVVTDNEKKMQATRANLEEENPQLTVYGCSAHILNLCGQDISPPAIINQVVEINKYFRNHHIPGALLNDISGSIKPQLPGETRWGSQYKCLDTYIKNRPFLLLIIAQNEDLIDDRIKTLIHNTYLFNEAKHLHQQQGHIIKALNTLQSDQATIATACEVWINLLECQDLKPHHEKIQKRFDQVMTPAHFLANLLHPKYKGQKLTAAQTTSAQQVVGESDPALLPELLSFSCDALGLPNTLTSETVIQNTNPIVWWQCVEKSGKINPALCQIARRLLKMPASSASLERVFSNFGFLQSKLRNRLGIQKAAKMVVCYRYLRGNHEVEW